MTSKVHNRPVFLNLRQIRLPPGGIVSIGHRITGVVMAVATPALIYLMDRSVSSPEGFASAKAVVSSLPFKVILFLGLWALLHHLFAGIRFLLLDLDVGVEKPVFRQTALAVLISAPLVAALLLGVIP